MFLSPLLPLSLKQITVRFFKKNKETLLIFWRNSRPLFLEGSLNKILAVGNKK